MRQCCKRTTPFLGFSAALAAWLSPWEAIPLSVDAKACHFWKAAYSVKQCRIYQNIAVSTLACVFHCADRLRLEMRMCQRWWDLLDCGSDWRPGLFFRVMVSGDRVHTGTWLQVFLSFCSEEKRNTRLETMLLIVVNIILEQLNWQQRYSNQNLRVKIANLDFKFLFNIRCCNNISVHKVLLIWKDLKYIMFSCHHSMVRKALVCCRMTFKLLWLLLIVSAWKTSVHSLC